MHVSSEDAEEDCDHEESPAYEGRRDVHGAAAVAVLSAALCPPGKAEPITAQQGIQDFRTLNDSFHTSNGIEMYIKLSTMTLPMLTLISESFPGLT